ncbi:unnamed protein product [Dicrocoelium dendriticum]|nr:unnamed protein product [Dicrocoelium dendriticum]
MEGLCISPKFIPSFLSVFTFFLAGRLPHTVLYHNFFRAVELRIVHTILRYAKALFVSHSSTNTVSYNTILSLLLQHRDGLNITSKHGGGVGIQVCDKDLGGGGTA